VADDGQIQQMISVRFSEEITMCTTCGCGEGNLYIEGDEHNPIPRFAAPLRARPAPDDDHYRRQNRYFSPPAREGDLHYGHGEAGTHAPGQSQRRMLEVEIDVLDKNNRLAARNRALCRTQQLVLNLVSSPGSGKTTLLTETLLRLKGKPLRGDRRRSANGQ
jgi:hydrogenase nickel incorporation protein HypB